MKKIFIALFVVTMFVGMINVKATTESELKTKMGTRKGSHFCVVKFFK